MGHLTFFVTSGFRHFYSEYSNQNLFSRMGEVSERRERVSQRERVPDPGWMSHQNLRGHSTEDVRDAMMKLVRGYGWTVWKSLDPLEQRLHTESQLLRQSYEAGE